MTPEIIAHRGASYLAPENTLIAFRKAMEIGADGVEMDVQQTLDGGLVIHHDYIIDLHTDISGRIYDMTEGELKDLDFGSWKDAIYKDEKIATLKEALDLCKSMEGCRVQLEMKSTMDNDPQFVPRVVEAIRAADIADRLVLISFNHDLLRQAKQLMPELAVGALLYGAFESMVLPPPVIWKDLGLTNGLEEEEAALDIRRSEGLEKLEAAEANLRTAALTLPFALQLNTLGFYCAVLLGACAIARSRRARGMGMLLLPLTVTLFFLPFGPCIANQDRYGFPIIYLMPLALAALAHALQQKKTL